MSPKQRAESIFEQVMLLSGMEPFDDPEHPAVQASSWIVNDDPLQICPGDPNLSQRYALALLFFYTSGDSWSRCKGDGSSSCPGDRFLSGSHECKWGGITCDPLDRVRKLHLGKSSFENFVPSSSRKSIFLASDLKFSFRTL
jgi:hypothetical protein